MMMVEEGYKLLHQEFVSNHTGTWPPEIIVITTSVQLSILLVSFLTQLLLLKEASSLKNFLLEFCVLVLPVLLCLTVCSDLEEHVCLGMLGIILIMIFYGMRRYKSSKHRGGGGGDEKRKLLGLNLNENPKALPFITNYRANMLLVTSICILAVDFPVFPRRFAKTENFGYGLMDIGVGSFIFVAGLVSQETRTSSSSVQNVLKSLKESIPLLALGLGRLFSVKASGYHEHVTEYGTHWNFFFTMAFTKVISSVFLWCVPVGHSWVMSLLIGICHETGLVLGAAQYILSSDIQRTDILSANREGIISLSGYVAIYLAGVSWGHHLQNNLQKTFNDGLNEVKRFIIWTCVMWFSLLYSQELFLPPSRRMANWAYYNWMVAYNLTALSLFLAIDLVLVTVNEFIIVNSSSSSSNNVGGSSSSSSSSNRSSNLISRTGKVSKKKHSQQQQQHQTSNISQSSSRIKRIPMLLEAISYNGLPYFLLANILTGLINLTIPTIHINGCPAVIILAIYVFILNTFIVILHKYKLRLKL